MAQRLRKNIMSRYEDDENEIVEDAPVRAPKTAKLVVEDIEEEEERPASASRVIRRGWGAADSVKHADSPYAQRLRVMEDPIVIKFLEDEPYASYRQHWVERSGQKSFTCIADIDPKGCPLCDAGSRPSTRFAFNVVLLSPDSDSTIKSYEVGPRVIDQLKNFHNDPRQGPLSKHFWAVSRSGKGATSATNHQLVKDRDLEEWNLTEPTAEELKDFRNKSYTPDIIQIPSRKDLQQIALEDLDD
jgi:hypothetical protein